MDPALLDLLEERGVKQLVLACISGRLGFGSWRPCDCSDEHVAQFPNTPHGPTCNAWRATLILGFRQQLVDRDHRNAEQMNSAADIEIEHIERGRRLTAGQIARRFESYGIEPKGKWFHDQVGKVLRRLAVVESRDRALAAEAQAKDEREYQERTGRHLHALINDPKVQKYVKERKDGET